MDGTVSKRISMRKTTWNEVESVIDVLANILSRLPVKCLLHYKTVSKLWYTVIKSSSFKKLQLSQSRENPVYMIYPFMDVLINLYLIDAHGKVIEKVSLPGCENLSSLCVICSYNGLVCFSSYPWLPYSMAEVVMTELEIRMCNPATREVWLLPKGSLSGEELATGVAFGPTSEYKIYRFFCPKSESEDVNPKCEIYSSSTRTWNGIGCVEHCPMGAYHLYVDGKVYWFVASDADNEILGAILSVDMEDSFGIVPLPEEVSERSFLVDFEGCLALVAVYEYDSLVNIWVLNNDESIDWELEYSHDIPFASMVSIESVAVRSELMAWWELRFEDEFERISPVVFTYAESLLPCNGNLGSEEEAK
ncbi:F-box protein At5g65850 [Morus notabilis]|uniref:F-box protein At5g65850 n=1 Tax=Morus notabilis TaxID=981085 RepID=UPI000CED69E3|nr:F-box protein At5g65850 [Morus notabilis]